MLTLLGAGRPQFTSSPASYGGLIRWWDAGSLTYANNTPIDNGANKLIDRSGTLDHAGQATAGNQPLCRTNIANGLRGIAFDGADDFLNFTNIAALTSITIIAVCLNAQAGAGAAGLLKDSVAGGGEYLDLAVGPHATWRLKDASGDIGISTDFLAPDQISIACVSIAGDTVGGSINNVDFYEGGVARSTQTVATFAWTGNQIGTALAVPVTTSWNGFLHELVIYNQKRTAAEIAFLYTNYFKPRWGIAFP